MKVFQEVEALAQSPLGAMTGTAAVLSAMITPAVLISACGSLAISTANRLGRTIDRTRRLSEEFASLARESAAEEAKGEQRDAGIMGLIAERRAMVFEQLERSIRRSRLLQRAMTRIYLAIGFFVATSVAVGIVAVTHARFTWVPVLLGMAGAGLLFHASALLILESRVGLSAIHAEMNFMWRLGRRHAPADADLATRRRRRWWKRARREAALRAERPE